MTDSTNSADSSSQEKASRIAAFLAAEGREKRELFRDLRMDLTADDLPAIAVAVRDPSPKLSARVASLLARHGRADLLEAQLGGLKPGKIEILRRKYRSIAGESSDGATPNLPATPGSE
ncbi:MAG: hypothetical protein AAF488_07200 [Planctomycetota bacterium]